MKGKVRGEKGRETYRRSSDMADVGEVNDKLGKVWRGKV